MKETHSVYHTGKRKRRIHRRKGKRGLIAPLISTKPTPYISNVDSEVGRLITDLHRYLPANKQSNRGPKPTTE